LGSTDIFHYLNQSDAHTIEGRSDSDEFLETMNAMTVMGINEREQEFVLRVVASILHLGNVNFLAGARFLFFLLFLFSNLSLILFYFYFQ